MTMAKLRSLTSAMVSQMKGNFCMVVEMMRLPCSIATFSSVLLSACLNILSLCPNAFRLSVICLSSTRRSVTMITEEKSGVSRLVARTASIESGHSPMSLYANHVSELLLPDPAECSMRYVLPTPTFATSAVSRCTTSSWW